MSNLSAYAPHFDEHDAMIAAINRFGTAYSKSIEWHPEYGSTVRVGSDYYGTANEALEEAWKRALSVGWTRPRWWQWWRWNETERRCPIIGVEQVTADAASSPATSSSR